MQKVTVVCIETVVIGLLARMCLDVDITVAKYPAMFFSSVYQKTFLYVVLVS